MDPVLMLRRKIQSSRLAERCPGIISVLAHVEQAEHLFNRGTSDRVSQYYTDAIYRANHAFEGILKEAYILFTGKDATRVTTQALEAHLLKSHILGERVVNLLKNYRENWRNPSTHDHTLFFDAVEGYVAVISVATFAYVLADQMLEHIAYKTEKQSTLQLDLDSVAEPSAHYGKSTLNSFCELLVAIANQKMSEISKPPDLKGEILGIIHALLEASPSVTSVTREPSFAKIKSSAAPDMLVEYRDTAIILEVRVTDSRGLSQDLIDQLSVYLSRMGLNHGALLLVSEPGAFEYRTFNKITTLGRAQLGVVTTSLNFANSTLKFMSNT